MIQYQSKKVIPSGSNKCSNRQVFFVASILTRNTVVTSKTTLFWNFITVYTFYNILTLAILIERPP